MFPEVNLKGQDKLRYDDKWLFVEKETSVPYDKIPHFKALNRALPSPLHLKHTWRWFMTLVNYQYRNPALMTAIMQFGCEVVQYDGMYAWSDCLKVYANLSRPIMKKPQSEQIW